MHTNECVRNGGIEVASLRNSLAQYACETLGCTSDSPWADKPGFLVLRHPLSNKWVGLIMDIPARYIGAGGDEIIDVVNLKLDPALIRALRAEEGYAPAWHMSKEHWLTVRLDGSVSFEKICALLEMSWNLVG